MSCRIDFIKIIFFCVNFLCKAKNQYLELTSTNYYVTDAQYNMYICKTIEHKSKCFNNLNCVYKYNTVFTSNVSTKTLLFCANFLRKMTKIKVSDNYITFCYFVHNISIMCATHCIQTDF
jgi:hypothetical protein